MGEILENAQEIDRMLLELAGDNERIHHLLVISLGRILKKEAADGANWERLVKHLDLQAIIDFLRVSISIDARWLKDTDAQGDPKFLSELWVLRTLDYEACHKYFSGHSFNQLMIDLNKSRFDFDKFPTGIRVLGDLDLKSKHIKALPRGLKVLGYLSLRSTIQMKRLPEDLLVTRDLVIDGLPIDELPSGMRINGSLRLKFSNIKSLPYDLLIMKELELEDNELVHLPQTVPFSQRVKVDGSLMLAEDYRQIVSNKGCTWSLSNP